MPLALSELCRRGSDPPAPSARFSVPFCISHTQGEIFSFLQYNMKPSKKDSDIFLSVLAKAGKLTYTLQKALLQERREIARLTG